MANIIINNFCNLNCSYCFANDIVNIDKNKEISLFNLKKIINWILKDSSNEYIGIIGGEPTLHSKFKDILLYLSENNIKSILFTNGIELFKYIDYIPKNMIILLNYNNPKFLTKSKQYKLNKTLKILEEKNFLSGLQPKVVLGCNLFKEENDYTFFWNIVKKYNINFIRYSVSVPKNFYDKDKYYNLMKPILLNFLSKAKQLNLRLSIDCNQIPKCYFTKKELDDINLILPDFICSPVIDIDMDFNAIGCFGLSNKKINCKDFNNIDELKKYMRINIIEGKIKKNTDLKCLHCNLYSNKKCQGGCLSFYNY